MKWIVLSFVSFYQRFISPLKRPSCRYHPTCSQYMKDAVVTHGGLKGSLMGVARIFRCHPFVQGGIDYVPLRFSLRKNPDDTYHGPYNRSLKNIKKTGNKTIE